VASRQLLARMLFLPPHRWLLTACCYTVKRPRHIPLTKVKISRGPGLILHGHFQQPHVSDKIQKIHYGCRCCTLHCKKRLAIFPSPAGMSLTTLSLAVNNLYMTSLFLLRESVVSDIPAGDGKLANLFLQCICDLLL